MTGEHRKRKRRPTTTEDYAAMLRRMIRSYGRRIGENPEAGLEAVRAIEAELTGAVNTGLAEANRTGGRSMTELADMLGVSKQAIGARVKAGEATSRARARAARPIRSSAVKAVPRALPGPSKSD
jgi:hypothetical protein